MSIQSTSAPAISGGAPPLADFRFDYRASLISPIVVSGIVRAVDIAMVAGLGGGLYALYVKHFDLAAEAPYLAVSLSVGLVATMLFASAGLYSVPSLRSPVGQLSRLALAWTSLFATLVAAMFFFKAGTSFSRVWLAARFQQRHVHRPDPFCKDFRHRYPRHSARRQEEGRPRVLYGELAHRLPGLRGLEAQCRR